MSRAPQHINRLTLTEGVVVFALSVVLCVGGAIVLGQDTNWDQRNYHYYVAYAFLHHRLNIDIAAAQVMSWFNPIGHLPHYFAITYLKPVVAGALIGAMSAPVLTLVYVVNRHVTMQMTRLHSRWVAVIGTGLAASGAIFVSELGSTFIDTLCGGLFLLALAAMQLTPSAIDKAHNPWLIGLGVAGVLAGTAVGIKVTHAVYALAMAVALVVAWPHPRLWKHALAFVAGGLAGFLLTGGYWCYSLWETYGNPVFPFYNGIFKSPWFPAENLTDTRAVPTSIAHALSYPFQALIPWRHVGAEEAYRDGRYALALVLLVCCVGWRAWRSRGATRTTQNSLARHEVFVVTFYFVAAGILLAMFGIFRYMATLEVLTPLVIWILLNALFQQQPARLIATYALLCAIVALTTIPADWGRRAYGDSWFAVSPPQSIAKPNTLYLSLGKDPLSYTLPFLSTRPGPMIAMDSWFEQGFVRDTTTPWHALAVEKIKQHSAEIRTLSVREPSDSDIVKLHALGVRVSTQSCVHFSSYVGPLLSCKCERL